MEAVTTIAATAAPAAASDARRRERVTLAGVVLVISVAAFEAIAVATAMPTVARSLHGVGAFGWAFTAYLLADIVGLVDAGARTDRHGPASSLVGGLALFAVGLLVDGLAPTMPVFLLGRALQGYGAGALIVAVYVLVARVFSEERRPRVFAAMSGAWVVPSIVGPAFAGGVTATAGWRWVFLGIAPLAALGAAILLPVVRRAGGGTGDDARRLGTRGAVLLAGGLALAQTAGQRLDAWSPLLLAAGLGLAAVPLRRLLPSGTARLRPGLPTVIVLRGVFSIAFFGAEAYLPLTLTRVHHGSPATVGIPLTLAAIGWASGSWWQGHVRAPDHAALLRNGFAVVAVAVSTLTVMTFTGVSMWVAVPIWAVAGFGMGLGYPVVSLIVLRLSPEQEQGANSSGLQVCDVIGGIVGVAVAATLVTAAGTAHLAVAMRIADPLLAVAAVAGVALSRRAVADG
jgi:MFS family permease